MKKITITLEYNPDTMTAEEVVNQVAEFVSNDDGYDYQITEITTEEE